MCGNDHVFFDNETVQYYKYAYDGAPLDKNKRIILNYTSNLALATFPEQAP